MKRLITLLLAFALALALAAPAAADLTVCVGKSLRIESERKPCRTTPKKPGRPVPERRMILAEMADVIEPAVIEPVVVEATPEAAPVPYVFDGNGLFLGRFIGANSSNWWVFTPDGETQVYGRGDGVAYGPGDGEPVTYQNVTPPLSLQVLQ